MFAEIAKSIQVKQDPMRDAPDIIEWITGNGIKTEKGARKPFEFDGHYFLVDPLRDWTPQQAIRKAAQIGFSTNISLKEFYAAEFNGWNGIHTFPTLRMVSRFVPSKVDGLIDVNPYLKRKIGRGAANSMQKKKFGLSWIFWAGCEGDNEGIMDTADYISNDEVDMSNPLTVEDFMSRTAASDYKGRWDFSNPTTDGATVSRRWRESDQKVMVHRCSRCSKLFVNNFYDCVDLERKIYICRACGKPLREEDRCYNPDTKYPQWVAKYPDRDISGYWIPHMIAPWISAKETITAFLQNSEEYFHRFVLAKPIADPEARIKRETILRNCTQEAANRQMVVAGIDQGKTFYMVIGNPKGIFTLETGSSWSDMDDYMRSYDVNSCVVDYLPDTDGAADFEKRWPGKVLLNYQNKDSKTTDVFRFDEVKRFCYTDKNPMISKVVKAFINGGIKIFMPPDHPRLVGRSEKDYKSYCAQAETLYRVEENTKEGNSRLVWLSSNGQDHWFLATCYYYAARERFALEAEVNEVEETPIIQSLADLDMPEFMEMETAEDEWLYV